MVGCSPLSALAVWLRDFRPGGRNLFLFLRAVHRARTHCRFERHEISSITLSMCLIRVSLLMERTSAVTMKNKRTRAVLCAVTFDVYSVFRMMEDASDQVNLA